MTIEKCLNEFSLYAGTKYTAKTYEVYLTTLEKFFNWVKKRELNSVSIKDICKYSIALRQRGQADSYNAYTMLIIRQFYKYFFLTQKTKLDWRLIPIPKYTVNSFVPIEDSEFYAMLEQITSSDFQGLRDRLIINFLYSSGVRVGELCKLNIENLHLSEHYASIFSEKNNKRRMILWDDNTQELLERYLPERQKLATTNAVFINLNFGRITTRSVERLVELLRKKANILRPITPHSFRHGCGMRAVARSMNLRYLQVFLGHKNLESSKFYMDYKDDGLVGEYRKIFCENKENKLTDFVERETVKVNQQFNYLMEKLK